MPRSPRQKEIRATQELVQQLVGRDLDDIRDTLKRIESQNKVIVIKLHNATVENEQLKVRIHQLTQILAELLMAPDNQSEAAAVLRDFLIQLKKQRA